MFRMGQINNHPNYAVTDDGRVFNIITGNELKQHPNRKGYMMVKLDNEKGMQVHRLVAFAFVRNTDLLSYSQVNHKDGNKSNNRFRNLEWTDNSENQLHAHRTGLQPKILGSAKTNARFTEEQVHEICKILQENPAFGGRRIAKMVGDETAGSAITRIKARENWRHISKLYSW